MIVSNFQNVVPHVGAILLKKIPDNLNVVAIILMGAITPIETIPLTDTSVITKAGSEETQKIGGILMEEPISIEAEIDPTTAIMKTDLDIQTDMEETIPKIVTEDMKIDPTTVIMKTDPEEIQIDMDLTINPEAMATTLGEMTVVTDKEMNPMAEGTETNLGEMTVVTDKGTNLMVRVIGTNPEVMETNLGKMKGVTGKETNPMVGVMKTTLGAMTTVMETRETPSDHLNEKEDP